MDMNRPTLLQDKFCTMVMIVEAMIVAVSIVVVVIVA